MMIFLVLDGVSSMDVYHAMYIVFFVIYTLYPQVVNHYSIVLLIYADLFVLLKYLDSLIR